MRAGIAALPDGRFEARDVLEAIGGDLAIHATVTVVGDAVGSTSPERPLSTTAI